jgi:regulator of protease activity HflC (stomatin/prohibitin superfamily)
MQDFTPQTASVAAQLEKQMHAERNRRENELDTLANIRTAEGVKQASILQSEGALITARNQADAGRYATETNTGAVADQLAQLTAVFGGDAGKASAFILELQRLEHLRAMAKTNNKVYFMSPDSMFPGVKVAADTFENGKQ